jgi:DNA (cytosine-5)-methyltransferase 1
MRVGSLFSGIGGLDLGLERAGMEVIWQVENDPYCQRVLKKHWPEVTLYDDIKDIDWSEVERPDLICGGFPCQPVSVAGKQLRQDDDRWLWPEFRRCIRGVRPRFVLVENVPGLLAGGMGDVLGDLAGLGYDAEWESLPASAFGAPHLRYRVFIVAESAAERCRRRENHQGQASTERNRVTESGDATHADGTGREQQHWTLATRPEQLAVERSDWWLSEPQVGRVAHGVPARVDRLRALGNAVVPQVAEWIGQRILATEPAS